MKTIMILKKVLFIAVVMVFSGLMHTLSAQNNPKKEILVYFNSGIQRALKGQTVSMVSSTVRAKLAHFNIKEDKITSAFPDFNEADTLKKTPEGQTISLPNMAKIFRIQIPDGTARERVIDSLKNLPNVLFAEPNMDAKLFSDPTYSNQWHLNNTGQSGGTAGADIKAEQAWSIFTGSSSVTIGVIDAGVETNHEDLSGKATGDQPGGDYHGTHVAGIAAAKVNNDLGGRGVD